MRNRRDNWPGVNQLSAPLVDQLVTDASDLEILVSRSANGSRIIDAGLKSLGSVKAGCRIAEICMADLGHATIIPSDGTDMNFRIVHVETEHPVLSCLGS
ncbi:MAG: methenyltetrahydromethanopterin cyclohydrolase, partial [Gammaproteobacteria bacterium]|nr:methenyltetrahydromethanopterin cyclohydrolase [Gammaproteobacteria bacterium]